MTDYKELVQKIGENALAYFPVTARFGNSN
jgi:hypothetical protein